eukprot:TRINITY_DN385_c0_g1_i1.p2 TRINITY_DN385_c0_g1~~TRINITY_DN385_c0_g1_i1.p2  ORF type:complete len:103 (-),score=21.04 TRINITY_DN385_c0_g1_i1:27-335(-)
MDYHGQYLSERWYTIIVALFGVVGFVIGFINQNLAHAAYSVILGFAVSVVVCVPSWPWFNKHPLEWRPAAVPEVSPATVVPTSSTTNTSTTSQSSAKKKKPQ